MREYYGNLRDCSNYVNNTEHRAVVWKEHPFYFDLVNSTKYTLEVTRKKWEPLGTLESMQAIRIQCNDWGTGQINVSVKSNPEQKCNFYVERGCMVERNFAEPIPKGKEFITPVFKNGVVKIIVCKDCSPNFGLVPKYDIRPIHSEYSIRITNHTKYNLVISTYYKDTKIARIKSDETKEVCVTEHGFFYIDTEAEEIGWQNEYHSNEKKILRVNGCGIVIGNGGKCLYSRNIYGPELAEPYIHCLYVNKGDGRNIEVWCNTIDFRLD